MNSLQYTVEKVTTPQRLSGCPEVMVRVAPEPLAPWLETERLSGRVEGPPFWAHVWPGSLALARYLLDGPAVVKGLRVLDFAAGSGVAAIAAAKAGAQHVDASDIDVFAVAAIELNASLNSTQVHATARDVIDTDERWHVVLVGDVFYEDELSRRIARWLATLARRGALVLIGDPGRSFLPQPRLKLLATYPFAPNPSWDSVLDRPARVWRLEPEGASPCFEGDGSRTDQ